MSETEIKTTLCQVCGVPIAEPEVQTGFSGGFLFFKPTPLCKDCLTTEKEKYLLAAFHANKFRECPYRLPHWRPNKEKP